MKLCILCGKGMVWTDKRPSRTVVLCYGCGTLYSYDNHMRALSYIIHKGPEPYIPDGSNRWIVPEKGTLLILKDEKL